MKHVSGILMPVASLPSKHGVGDFGKNAFEFIDLLDEGGFSLWQILPLNPLGYGHSPYQPFSSFAIEELYIDLDDLHERGLIGKPKDFHPNEGKILYEESREFKTPYLRRAFFREMKMTPGCLREFIASHPWVKEWSLFMSLKRRNGGIAWDEWPEKDKILIEHGKKPTHIEKVEKNYEIWLQKTLYEQWGKIKKYANSKGIRIIGDVPFYVGYDSCDVWANQNLFLLNKLSKKPDWIAGVPPDYFSKTGQRWGNPIYDWEKLEKNGFSFILNRLVGNAELYDVIRLDHFRAFDTYWKIPASCETAIDGAWIEAPGYKFFDLLLAKEHPEIIAEDLGDLRPEVLVLRDHYSFPGMNVIEFTFEDAEISHKPGYDKENMVSYLGTHDNDTMLGYINELPGGQKALWERKLEEIGLKRENIVDSFIEYALRLPSKYSIFSLQDILGLGSEGRINVPGIIDDINWTWKLEGFEPFKARISFLKELNDKYGRSK